MNSFDFLISINAIAPKLVQGTIDRMYANELDQSTHKIAAKRRPLRKVLLIAAAVLLILSLVVCAVRIMSGWLTQTEGEYNDLPSAQRCIKDSGYEPILFKEFENGYVFQKGYLQQIQTFDEAGAQSALPKSFDFVYERDGDTVRFTQIKDDAPVKQQGKCVTTTAGTELFYSSQINMVVPDGYELTKEQQKAVESGELYFSYASGSDAEAETHTVSNVSWHSNGIYFLLQQIDGLLTVEDLLSMASSILPMDTLP